jgi:protein-S-isoprenylcysteine O-methyltransferase Ste14
MNDRLKGNLLVVGQLILLALLFLVPPVKEVVDWLNDTIPFAVVFPGIAQIVLFVAIVILISGGLGLGPALTAHPIPKSKAQLQTSGLYRWVRHPIYLGLIVTAISFTLSGGLFPHVLFAIALFILLNYKAKFEERLLAERFPEYADYASRTGRFLPRLKG